MGETSFIPWEACSDYLLDCGSIHKPYRFCVNVLDKVQDLVPYDQALFLMLDGNRKIVRSHFVGLSERWSSMYLDYYSHSSLHGFGLDAEVETQSASSFVELLGWSDLIWIHDDFMASYIRPRRLSQTLSFGLMDLKGAPATVFCLDRLVDGEFSDREVAIIKLLAAHLGNLYQNLFVRPPGQVRIWDKTLDSVELTPREKEVLDLLCQGIKPVYIARKLRISIGTTNKHIAHIYKKYGVSSKQELLVKLLGK